MDTAAWSYKYSWPTRILHGGLAGAVIVQLVSSLAMEPPRRESPGNWFFEVHEYAGLAAFFFAYAFLAHVIVRHLGTEKGLLFPWFSSRRRAELWSDARDHFKSFHALRLPAYQEHAPLPSAVQGLGLLLIAAMASTGALFYVFTSADAPVSQIAALSLEVHKLLANLVWAYLVAHAGIACVHHFTNHQHLNEMWSFRRRRPSTGKKL
tara:strand:+ start:422 stop:1045 length:624 start_codon:yes stop_codon:yes gene_type:complete